MVWLQIDPPAAIRSRCGLLANRSFALVTATSNADRSSPLSVQGSLGKSSSRHEDRANRSGSCARAEATLVVTTAGGASTRSEPGKKSWPRWALRPSQVRSLAEKRGTIHFGSRIVGRKIGRDRVLHRCHHPTNEPTLVYLRVNGRRARHPSGRQRDHASQNYPRYGTNG